jgi:hypothetical protein
MRARVISPIFLVLLIGVAALPAGASEHELAGQAAHSTVTGLLPGATKFTPLWQLAACKPNGETCSADPECCSGACKTIGEARACVPK